jgi:hypothetical protein
MTGTVSFTSKFRCETHVTPCVRRHVCFWEDDGQDDGDADENRGGPNGSLRLTEARANYLRLGACEEKMVENVRPPRPEELP